MKRAQRKANLKKLLARNGSVENKVLDVQDGRRQLRSAKLSALAGISDYLITDKDTARNEAVDEIQHCDINENAEKPIAGCETNPAHACTLKRRLNLTRFIFKNGKDITPQEQKVEHDSDDFRTPVKKIKRAPKLSQPPVTAKSNTTCNRRKTKRQQKITTAFLRNEQMFSEIVAQHSIAENFNPDEVQLALALSRSEVETEISNKNTVEVSKEPTASMEENIRNKLRKIGFRTASRDDYTHCLTAAFLNGHRRTKTKWANKFTALTLRNPTAQSKKLNAKIEAILKQDFETQSPSSCDHNFEPYEFRSCMLSQHAVVDKVVQGFRNMETLSTTEQLERFFITELFPVTQLPAGHLLKDGTIIPGRDLSPERGRRRLSAEARKYQKFYEDLEACFLKKLPDPQIDSEAIVSTLEENEKMFTPTSELDVVLESISSSQMQCKVKDPVNLANEITQTIVENVKLKPSPITETCPSAAVKNVGVKSSPITETFPSEAVKNVVLKSSRKTETFPSAAAENVELKSFLTTETFPSEAVESVELKSSPTTETFLGASVEYSELKSTSRTESCLTTQTETRSTSPDLFADTDSDDALVVEENQLSNIKTYEVYSSDDADITQDDVVTLNKDESDHLKTPTPKKHEVSKRLNFLDIANEKILSFLDASHTLFVEDIHKQKEEVGSKFLNESISKALNQISSLEDNILDLEKNCSIVEENTNPELREEIPKEISYKKKSIASIDLTQSDNESADGYGNNDSDNEDDNDSNDHDDDVCILLSDDEVNYSIIKANAVFSKSLASSVEISDSSFCEENVSPFNSSLQKAPEHNFSLLDLVDVEHSFQMHEKDDNIFPKTTSFDLSDDIEPINKDFLSTQFETTDSPTTPVKERHSISDMLKQQRAEFGILESQSEPFSQSPPLWMRTPVKVTPQKKLSISPADSLELQQHQQQQQQKHSCSQKFQSFLFEAPPKTHNRNVFNFASSEYDDFDEFDRLVYGSPLKRVPDTAVQRDVPAGLTQLLTAEISLDAQCVRTSTESQSSAVLHAITPEKAAKIVSEEEIKINNHVYTVRVTNSPKPNFAAQSEAEILKQLYNFGIKPLKRNQAIKLLEYIYNETHPIIESAVYDERQGEIESKSDNDASKDKGYSLGSLCNEKDTVAEKNCGKMAILSQSRKFNLHDCNGDILLRFTSELFAELRNDEEVYILQKNVTKKTQHPLLPFHIAWYNLVCSNTALHESILMYEPIDLQEIYLFLKSLGYRYDPKDLKSFFDRRCILFRYDLTPPEKQGNRHIHSHS